jgi:hypothetical protein
LKFVKITFGASFTILKFSRAVCYFLLAQKVTKKGTLPNASTRWPTRTSLGKEASPPGWIDACLKQFS